MFCTACNSTAFSYPLIDGELFFGPAGPAIRVPLDGTEYDLTTGGGKALGSELQVAG